MAVPEGLSALLCTLLCAVLAPAVLGAGLVQQFGLSPRAGWRLFVAWSYLCGQAAQAVLTALWIGAGQPLPGWSLSLLGATLGAVLFVRGRRSSALSFVPRRRADPWVAATLLVLLLLWFDQSLLRSLQPLIEADEADIWAAKARMLYSGGPFRPWLDSAYVRHPAYPLFDPLLQVVAFAANGRVLLWENRLPLQFFGPVLLLLLADFVDGRLPRWLACAVLVAFASSVPFFVHSTTAYADVLLALALFAALDAWRRFEAERALVYWRLCCVAFAVLLATKNEGAMLALAAIAAIVVARLWLRGRDAPLRLRWNWLWLLLPGAVWIAGRLFNAHFGLVTDLVDPTLSSGRGLMGQILHWLPQRAGPVATYYFGLLTDGSATRWLLLAMLLAPLAAVRGALVSAQVWSWLTVGFAVLGYMLVFVGTTADQGGPDGAALGLQWHLRTAADRTLLHVLPVAVMSLGLWLARQRRG